MAPPAEGGGKLGDPVAPVASPRGPRGRGSGRRRGRRRSRTPPRPGPRRRCARRAGPGRRPPGRGPASRRVAAEVRLDEAPPGLRARGGVLRRRGRVARRRPGPRRRQASRGRRPAPRSARPTGTPSRASFTAGATSAESGLRAEAARDLGVPLHRARARRPRARRTGRRAGRASRREEHAGRGRRRARSRGSRWRRPGPPGPRRRAPARRRRCPELCGSTTASAKAAATAASAAFPPARSTAAPGLAGGRVGGGHRPLRRDGDVGEEEREEECGGYMCPWVARPGRTPPGAALDSRARGPSLGVMPTPSKKRKGSAPLAAIVLAAGKGTRMKSRRAKVLHRGLRAADGLLPGEARARGRGRPGGGGGRAPGRRGRGRAARRAARRPAPLRPPGEAARHRPRGAGRQGLAARLPRRRSSSSPATRRSSPPTRSTRWCGARTAPRLAGLRHHGPREPRGLRPGGPRARQGAGAHRRGEGRHRRGAADPGGERRPLRRRRRLPLDHPGRAWTPRTPSASST